MTSFKLLEKFEPYYLDPSRIYKVIRRKYQNLHRHNTTYLYATCLSLNRFFHLITSKIVLGLQKPASGKMAIQFMEDLEW